MHWSEGFSMISSSKIRIRNGRRGDCDLEMQDKNMDRVRTDDACVKKKILVQNWAVYSALGQ
jgi:hypothetical protein